MNTDHTLEEVGKQFDVTRERIRQIEASASEAASPWSVRATSKLPVIDRRDVSVPSRSKSQLSELGSLALFAPCFQRLVQKLSSPRGEQIALLTHDRLPRDVDNRACAASNGCAAVTNVR